MFDDVQNDIDVQFLGVPEAKTVGVTAVRLDTTVLDAREGITLFANKRVYIGVSNAVTTSNYYWVRLEKGTFIALGLKAGVQVWAISDSASAGADDVMIGQFK